MSDLFGNHIVGFSHEAAHIYFQALVAKLRSEVQHQGYLQKTGPNMKGE